MSSLVKKNWFRTHDLFFAGDVDPTTRRRKSLFSNTLVLPGFNLYEALKVDDPEKLAWRKHIFDFRARNLEQAVLDGADLTKADLTGAQLQGAVLDFAKLEGAPLDDAHLEGASLFGAQLQGASLFEAQLQGASLDQAQLQGASLDQAHIQGASLFGAQLQGASLEFAELQGAWLRFAQLHGASLEQSQLHGASLEQSQLQGASLSEAQLQGASLYGAKVNATELSGAFLWRTNWGEIDPAKLGTVRLDAALKRWKSVWPKVFGFSTTLGPWDAKAYAALRASMNGIPEGQMRDQPLERIKILDCGNPDKNLASCNPAVTPPREVLAWQKKLAAASVDDTAYAKALATELQGLVCTNNANAIYALRGILRKTLYNVERLAHTGRLAPALVDFIMSKDCPVSASLTANDNTKLLKIKQDAEQKFPPPPTSKQQK